MHPRTLSLIILPLLALGFAASGFAGEPSKKSAATQQSPSKKGEEVYLKVCAACHATGVAGAPKTGDKAAWAHHLKAGIDHMVKAAIQGKGAMPPRGGQATLSDEEVRAAVSYMVEKSK
ncbi:MAG: c-type cytochrome [Desulfuromonadales bacterium]|nr:c-type cytochrome [Desulfuromonadales bacterium]